MEIKTQTNKILVLNVVKSRFKFAIRNLREFNNSAPESLAEQLSYYSDKSRLQWCFEFDRFNRRCYADKIRPENGAPNG